MVAEQLLLLRQHLRHRLSLLLQLLLEDEHLGLGRGLEVGEFLLQVLASLRGRLEVLLGRLEVLDGAGSFSVGIRRRPRELLESLAPQLELGVLRLDVRAKLGDVSLERLNLGAQRLDLLGVTRGGLNLGGEIRLDRPGAELSLFPLRVRVGARSLELRELSALLHDSCLEHGGDVCLDALELLLRVVEQRLDPLDVGARGFRFVVRSLGFGDSLVARALHSLDALQGLVADLLGIHEGGF